MVTGARLGVDELVQDGSGDFRIHGRIYNDPEVFALEMERVFGRSWVYVAHESEVAQPGDYKTTYIGLQPVIVARGADDGQVRVLLNRCRHRGATVCQFEQGNSSYFRCAYHGWTYNNQGNLIGVTYRDGYSPDFDFGQLGLVPVARVASYRGFVFASLSPLGPSLEEHLGNAKPCLDAIVDQGPEGIELSAGIQKYGYNGNWKIQLENSVDNYHVNFVHQTFFDIVARRLGQKSMDGSGNPHWRCRDLGNGHGMLDFGTDLSARRQREKAGGNLGDIPFNFTIFPNLAFVGIQVRVIRPVAVDRTEVALYPALLKGVPAEVNTKRLRQHEQFFGPAGFGGPDDVEVAMQRVMDGMSAKGNEWLVLVRGLHQEELDERGVRSNAITMEAPQRAVYRQWKRVMAEG